MTEYIFRSRNTGRESKTRIRGALSEYFDYFRSDCFDIPKSYYIILIGVAPMVVLGTYWRSLHTNEPIEKMEKAEV